MDEIPKEVEFYYEVDPAYRIIPANGVWGGVTSRGDIKLDFFVEGIGTPQRVKNKVLSTGKLGEEIEREPSKRFVRRLQIGVLLSLEQAERIAEFIKQRIEQYNVELKKKKKE